MQAIAGVVAPPVASHMVHSAPTHKVQDAPVDAAAAQAPWVASFPGGVASAVEPSQALPAGDTPPVEEGWADFDSFQIAPPVVGAAAPVCVASTEVARAPLLGTGD